MISYCTMYLSCILTPPALCSSPTCMDAQKSRQFLVLSATTYTPILSSIFCWRLYLYLTILSMYTVIPKRALNELWLWLWLWPWSESICTRVCVMRILAATTIGEPSSAFGKLHATVSLCTLPDYVLRSSCLCRRRNTTAIPLVQYIGAHTPAVLPGYLS